MTAKDRKIFQENIRLLAAKAGMEGYVKTERMWEEKIKDRKFPMAVNNYQAVFRKKEAIPDTMTVSTAVRAIEVINFFLEEPFEARKRNGELDDQKCFELFVEKKFTEEDHPAIRKEGALKSCYEKFVQDYYVYMPTEDKDVLSVGFLSMYLSENGVQAYLICHLRRRDLLFDRNIWNIFKDYDAENVKERFRKEFEKENGGQADCRLYASKSVTFNQNHMICDFISVENPNMKSQLFLDISSCVTKETPDSLLYQFGCGAITHILGASTGFSASHILLVNAMGNTEERSFALQGKRSETFLEKYLDPIDVSYAKEAIEKCNLQHLKCNAIQSADFYRWNKAKKIEELRMKKEEKRELSQQELELMLNEMGKMMKELEVMMKEMKEMYYNSEVIS